MRERLRPVLSDSLEAVGMRPANLPERAAAEDFLARMDDDGFFTNLASRYGVTLVKIGATAEAAGALQQLYGN